MKLLEINKTKEGKFLKNYELKYINKAGREKTFEIVSHRDLQTPDELGRASSGVAIVAVKDSKLLLLHEFRCGINRYVYNLCAGRLEKGETIEECVRRELYEETGLSLVRIIDVLRPAYAAATISDISNTLVLAQVSGTLTSEHTSDNEEIEPAFYDKQEVTGLLNNCDFTSRAQAIAYSFTKGAFDQEGLK